MMGYRIGTSHVGSPACADDVALLARSVKELQQQTRAAEQHASKDRYNINESKSDILVFNSKTTPDDWNSIHDVRLFNHPVRAAEAAVHLGVDRRTSSKVSISKNIQKGRATTYSLMGADMHGINGIKPTVSLQMWEIFAKPRMLFGLETITLSTEDFKKLESYQTKLVKQLQGLADRAANVAAFALIGAEPLESAIDRMKLTLLGQVVANNSTLEHQIARRQLAIIKN
jgi:hypothetical protein